MLEDQQQKLRAIINVYLKDTKKKNPRFSLRALAKKLEVSPGYLSEFLQGKKSFSPQTMERIVPQLVKSPEERKDLLEFLNYHLVENLKSKSKNLDSAERILTVDEFAKLNEWHYYALRSLVSLEDFRLDLPWIAKKLGIGLDAVDQALNQLVEMGIIKIENGKVLTTTMHLKTPDNVLMDDSVLSSMKSVHGNAIDHARSCLEKLPRNQRDITWVNIPCDEGKLEKARELIRKFQDDLITFLEDGPKNQVMRLTIQLCPLIERDPGSNLVERKF